MPTPTVADAIARYHELLAGRFDPAGWWQQHVDEVQRHWHDEAPLEAYILRPLFIDEPTYAGMRESLTHLMRAFGVAVDRLATDEALRRTLGIPAYLEPLLDLDRAHGRPSCIGRLDGMVGPDGRLTVIEFNSEPQSAPLQYELERSYERLPITRAFTETFGARTINLYEQVFETLAGRRKDARMPCVAVLDRAIWKSGRRAALFRALMYCSSRGCPVLYVEPEELEYRNGKLTAGGVTVDMVSFATWEMLINERKRLAKVLRAIADNNVQVYAGVSRGLLASYKVILELLSDRSYRDMFDADMVAALDRHIPWTRLLRERTTDRDGTKVDLLPFVASNRERLVIKPAGGGGGVDITIGRDVSDDTWAAALKKGVTQSWIVQELAPTERQSFPVVTKHGEIAFHDLNCEFTPYVWNGSRVEGVLCRAVAGSVISDLGDREIGISNGVETATWIIERR